MDTTTQSSFMDRYLTPLAVLGGAGLIALAVAYGRGDAPADQNNAASYQETILEIAGEVPGIDPDTVSAIATGKSDAYLALIDASRAEGAELGISGTPTIILGNQIVQNGPDLYNTIAAAVANPVPPSPTDLISKVTTAGEPFVGNPDAPVTIAYYFDYKCGYCHQFMQTVMPKLYSDFVETGKLKIVLKDFQFLSSDSVTGAIFGRALWESNPAEHFKWFLKINQLPGGH